MKPLETKPKWSISFGQNDATIYSEGTIASIDDTMVDWKQNAHLMATAPDMLDALLRLTHPMADEEDMEFAFKCIRKARGFAPTDFEDVRASCHEKCAADAIGGHAWANR